MNFLRTTWGLCLLGALALPGCGGDDTPTPNGLEGEAGLTGAGGAGNDASAGSDSSTGKAGGSATDSGSSMMCKKTGSGPGADSGNEHVVTVAMAVTGADLAECKATLPEAGNDGGEDAGGSSCMACLCGNCPLEAKTCSGNPNCSAVSDCCRAACKACAPPTPEGGSDAPASEGGGDGAASTSDGPAGDGATE